MIVLISYDLKQPGRNYTPLYDAIKSLGDWQHPLESVWFVEVDDNTRIDDIVEALKQNADKNDLFFAVKITNYYQGWLSKSFWNWINAKEK